MTHVALKTKRRLRGRNGSIALREISIPDYARLNSIGNVCFRAEEFGWFGMDEKILVLRDGWELDKSNIAASMEEIADLSTIADRELRERQPPPHYQTSFGQGMGGCLEVKRGIFTSPTEELEVDRVLKDGLEEAASRVNLQPIYTGMDTSTGIKSYGFHIHWSAGNLIDTLLLYLSARNELWRITAFSANSPRLENLWVGPMCERLGTTYVTELVPRCYRVTDSNLRNLMSKGREKYGGEKKYTLLIDNVTGTLELRTADPDPKSPATVAYSTLLVRALQIELFQTMQVPQYSKRLISHNMTAAKTHAISNDGTVEVLVDGEIVEVPIQQEMIRHFERVIEPLMRNLNSNGSKYVPDCVADEIRSRIYDGQTPARKQADLYMQMMARTNLDDPCFDEKKVDALNTAQKLNLASFGF